MLYQSVPFHDSVDMLTAVINQGDEPILQRGLCEWFFKTLISKGNCWDLEAIETETHVSSCSNMTILFIFSVLSSCFLVKSSECPEKV